MIRIQAQPQAGGESRLAGIQMAMLTLRCMEHYRNVAGDHDSALILLAVVAISSERLTRGGLDEELRSLDAPLRRWSDVKSLNCELVARLRMTV